MPADVITHEEWIAELERLQQAEPASGDDGMTVREMIDSIGWKPGKGSRERMREMLRPLVESGRVICGTSRRVSLDGRRQWVPVYRFTKE